MPNLYLYNKIIPVAEKKKKAIYTLLLLEMKKMQSNPTEGGARPSKRIHQIELLARRLEIAISPDFSPVEKKSPTWKWRFEEKKKKKRRRWIGR